MVVMQAELALPPEDEQEIRNRIAERLRARGFDASQANNVRIGRPLITRGKATIMVMDQATGTDGGGVLVQKITVPTPPSLFGNNAVSIGVELSELGAPVFEAAMKSAGGGSAGAVTMARSVTKRTPRRIFPP